MYGEDLLESSPCPLAYRRAVARIHERTYRYVLLRIAVPRRMPALPAVRRKQVKCKEINCLPDVPNIDLAHKALLRLAQSGVELGDERLHVLVPSHPARPRDLGDRARREVDEDEDGQGGH